MNSSTSAATYAQHTGTCRLCDNIGEIQNSHIIPNFFFKRFADCNGVRSRYLHMEEGKNPYSDQGGIKEPLLCKNCESTLSRYENYARDVLYKIATAQKYTGNFKAIINLDYTKFKLFQMSILWRAAESSHSMFSQINLGHANDKIKSMLANSDPGDFLQYPCFITEVSHMGETKEYMLSPIHQKHNAQDICIMSFGGFKWAFFICDHINDEQLHPFFIKPNGKMIIYKSNLSDDTHFLQTLSQINFSS